MVILLAAGTRGFGQAAHTKRAALTAATASGYAASTAKSRVYQGNPFSVTLTPTGATGARFAQNQSFTLTGSDGSFATVTPPPAGGPVGLPMRVAGNETVAVSSGGTLSEPVPAAFPVTVLPALRITGHTGAPPAGGDADNSGNCGYLFAQPIEGRAHLLFLQGESVGFHIPYQIYGKVYRVNAWEVYDFAGNLVDFGACDVNISGTNKSDTIICSNVTAAGSYRLFLYDTTVAAGAVDFRCAQSFVVLANSRAGLPSIARSATNEYNYAQNTRFELLSNAVAATSEGSLNGYSPPANQVRLIRRTFSFKPTSTLTGTLACDKARITVAGQVTQPFSQFPQCGSNVDLYTPVVSTFQAGTSYRVTVENFSPGTGPLEAVQFADGTALGGVQSAAGTANRVTIDDFPASLTDPSGDHNDVGLRACLGEAGSLVRYPVLSTSQPGDFANAISSENALVLGARDPGRGPRRIIFNFEYLNSDARLTPAFITNFIGGILALGLDPANFVVEGANEPQGGDPAAYGAKMAMLSDAVKAANPGVQVVGASSVDVFPDNLAFQRQAIAAAGGKVDGLSFHVYNAIVGDYADGKTVLDALAAWQNASGFSNLPLWQTEQGADSAYHGTMYLRYSPRLVLAQKLLLERYGVPAGRDLYWAPTNDWQQDPTAYARGLSGFGTYSLYPVFAALRTWGDEIFGLAYGGPVSFGGDWDKRLFGNLYTGAGGGMMALATNGASSFALPVLVTGSVASLSARRWDGEDLSVPVVGGTATLPLDELMLYVRIPPGVTVLPNLPTLGPDLARAAIPSTSEPVSGSLSLLNDGSDGGTTRPIGLPGVLTITTPTSQQDDEVVLDFGGPTPFNAVHLSCPFPFQGDGTLLDFAVQSWNGSAWTTLQSVTQAVNGLPATDGTQASRLDDRSDRAFLFLLSFPAVTASKVRVLIYSASYGVSPTAAMAAYGSVDTPTTNQPTLREIAVYNAAAAPPPVPPVILTQPASQTVNLGGVAALSVTAAGSGLQYQWRFNGAAIAGATAPTLTLPGVSLARQGTYGAVVSNAAGSAASSLAFVTVTASYQDWATLYFGAPANDALRPAAGAGVSKIPVVQRVSRGLMPFGPSDPSAPEADPDGDGVPNLLEYVLGTNPNAGMSTGDALKMPQLGVETVGSVSYLVFSFNRSSHETATLSFEGCADLEANAWQTLTPDITELSDPDPVTFDQTVRWKVQADSSPARFFRLRASF